MSQTVLSLFLGSSDFSLPPAFNGNGFFFSNHFLLRQSDSYSQQLKLYLLFCFFFLL